MIIEDRFQSSVWREERRYQVILPRGYNESAATYPILYLLHGVDQNYKSWTRYTFLEVMAEAYPFLMAIPDCGNRWYREGNEGILRNRDYIIEFVSFIDGRFRTERKRNSRGVAGISLGGHAGFLVGLTHPEQFGSVSALSGVMDITNHRSGDPTNREGLLTLEQKLSDIHLFSLAERLNGNVTHFLFDSGTEDEISFEDSFNFDRVLKELRIPHTFNTYSGKHDWRYWDLHLKEHLDFHNACFGKESCTR